MAGSRLHSMQGVPCLFSMSSSWFARSCPRLSLVAQAYVMDVYMCVWRVAVNAWLVHMDSRRPFEARVFCGERFSTLPFHPSARYPADDPTPRGDCLPVFRLLGHPFSVRAQTYPWIVCIAALRPRFCPAGSAVPFYVTRLQHWLRRSHCEVGYSHVRTASAACPPPARGYHVLLR